LIDPDKRRAWFAGGPTELRLGGKIMLAFRFSELSAEPTPAGRDSECVVTGEITQYEPPRLLSCTWGTGPDASEVSFEIAPQANDVLLLVTHRRLPNRETVVNVASGWHTHLDILTDILEGSDVRRFWATKLKMEVSYRERLAGQDQADRYSLHQREPLKDTN
jgi:uncharacterized protein YndB with AHSA1/START domain